MAGNLFQSLVDYIDGLIRNSSDELVIQEVFKRIKFEIMKIKNQFSEKEDMLIIKDTNLIFYSNILGKL